MPYLSRAQWGARSPHEAPTPFASRSGIGVHWEGPRIGITDHAQCTPKVQGIQNDHMDGRNSDHRPWNDIAYNFVVCPHGYVYEGRGTANRPAAVGVGDTNAHWSAVCYLGGDGDGVTPEGWQGLKDAVAVLRGGGFPDEVRGHRDFMSTQCPGDEIYAHLSDLHGGNAPTPVPTPTPAPVPSGHPPFPGRLLYKTTPLIHGDDVRVYQQRLRDRGWRIGVDGWFGAESDSVTRQFQKEKHLTVDGVVGRNTWDAIWQSPVT